MDRKTNTSRLGLTLLLTLAFSAPLELAAQVPVDENGQPLTAIDYEGDAGADVEDILALPAVELEELVGRIALYPDDLLAIILPASTYPLEIVQAARFLDELAIDGSLQPDESWDESVVALLNYPEVVHMLDENIDWTWRLGEAVISQQADVIAAVESFRDRAYAAGNLESDERQTVSNDNGVIEISPVDEEIIYVPYYEPEEVVIYQPRRRVYFYHPYAYPVYYYPYPYGYSFASGYFWGVTTAYTIGWNNRYLYVHHPSYWGHPYYGRHYYGHYYRYPSISVYNSWYVQGSHRSSHHRYRDGDHWRPRHRSGARPETRSVRNRHYPSGGSSSERTEYRATDRSRQDVQNGTRTQTRTTANRRSRPDRNSGSAIDGRTDIQFRERANPDRGQTSRRIESGGSTSDRQNRTTGSSASRQRMVAQSSRQAPSSARPTRSRQQNQHNVTVRQQPQATRTSRRSGASQRPTTQQTSTRPSVQRQAPAVRQSSRPAVQRQSPVQRAAPSVAPRRQQSASQSTSSSRRNTSRSNPRRKQEH